MPPKKEIFKGEPDTTYVVNHPAEGEIKFKTNEKGEHTPKNDKERWAAEYWSLQPKTPEPPPEPESS